MIRFFLPILVSVVLITFDGASSHPKPRQRSLVIVIDTTGSMTSELDQVRHEAKMIVEHAAVLPEKPYYNFIFVDFNDPDPGSIMVTTNKDEMFNTLDQVSIVSSFNNNECPELAMQGIQRALETALYKSSIFVFTDADARDKHLETNVKRLIQEKQSSITFFITEGCAPQAGGYQIHQRLANMSGGLYLDLNENDISTVLQATKDILDINRDLVFVTKFNSQTYQTYVVTDNTSDITITVTGSKPNVDFTDPDNHKVDVQPKVDLQNVLINQIKNPKPGPWVIDAKVTDIGTLQITQVSPLSFKFGFSKSPPDTIKETFIRPLKDIENYLVVAPLNMSADSTFTHVTITSDSGKKLYNLHQFLPGLFITDAFLQPEQFTVTIHGKDAKGNEIERLISTYIQPETESEPSVSIIEPKLHVLQYGEIVLKCIAKSFTEMTMKWIKGGNILKEINASQSYELEHLIPIASLDDNEEYTCEASNRMGKNYKTLSVTVTPRPPPPPEVTVYPEAKQISPNGTIRIKCSIKYPYDSIYWTFKPLTDGKKIDDSEKPLKTDYVEADRTLVIPLAKINHAGTYTCVAKVNRTEVKDSASIDVGHEAKIIDSIQEKLFAVTGSSAKLTCYSQGEPEPEIQWFFSKVSGKRIKKLDNSTDTLIINNLNFTHDGVYECEVYNGVGKTQKRIIILNVAALKEPIIANRTDLLIVANTDVNRTFVCECAHCLPMRSYTWTFNDVPIKGKKRGNLHVNSIKTNTDYFRTTLTIVKTRHSNEGVYKCVLENDLNSATHKFVLNILKQPGIQRIVVSNSIIDDEGVFIVQENQTSTLDCQFTGLFKTFDWFKDEVRIASGRYLKLDAATYDDSGVYRCKVSNSKGSDDNSVTVQVHGRPRIVGEFPQKIVKLVEVELDVECKATGFPQPKVHWENEDGIVVKTANGVLNLPKYVNSFSTSFKCHAENSVGSTSRSTVIRYQQDILISNNVIQLLCPLRAIDKVEWYKDNEMIEEPSPQFTIYNVILQLGRPDVYNYSDIYRCQTGQKEFFFNVTMKPPPAIEAIEVTVDGIKTPLKNNEITVWHGQEVTVRCLVKRHPLLRVYWRTKRRHLDGGSILYFANITTKHEGVYNCFARTDGNGKEKRQIKINVLS